MQEQPNATAATMENVPLSLVLFYAGVGAAFGLAAVLMTTAIWRYLGGATSTAGALHTVDAALSHQARVMGLPLADNTKAYWYVARAGGILAYLLLWFATLYGVLMSTKLTKGLVAYGLHEFFPILAMIFATLHAVVLLGDQYIGFSVGNLVLPFTAPYRPLWTGLGTLAIYLSVALIASFYLKRLVSRRVWRMFHYATYLAFTLALVHGLMAGTDSTLPAVRWMYLLTGASLVFVTVVRVLTFKRGASSALPAEKQAGQQPAAQPAALPVAQPVQPALAPANALRPALAAADVDVLPALPEPELVTQPLLPPPAPQVVSQTHRPPLSLL